MPEQPNYAKQSQFADAQMNVTFIIKEDYESIRPLGARKNKANSKPILEKP
jgi:hypothetical protein